jgi:hypothetical protein
MLLWDIQKRNPLKLRPQGGGRQGAIEIYSQLAPAQATLAVRSGLEIDHKILLKRR